MKYLRCHPALFVLASQKLAAKLKPCSLHLQLYMPSMFSKQQQQQQHGSMAAWSVTASIENAKLQKHAAGENVYELIVGTSLDDLTRELTSLSDVKATKCHPKTRNTAETHNSIRWFVLGF